MLFISIAVCVGSPVPAQQATEATHFHWSQRKAYELPYHATVARSTELNPAEKSALIRTIKAEIRHFMDDQEIASEKELDTLVRGTRIQLLDLNQDGVPEVLAQAFDSREGCGATGNCTFWVFQKQSDGSYNKLLDTRGKEGIGGIELITVETTRTHGFLDFTLAAHDSAAEKDLSVYRFNGRRYVQFACYLASWIDDRDPTKARQTPAISPIRC